MQSSMSIHSLEVHPALALMPEMPGEQWSRFVESVRANGVTEPVAVQDGFILDGRQRWKAARECDHTLIPVRQLELSQLDQMIFIMQSASLRQHLSDDQRAIVGARMRKPLSTQLKLERARKAGNARGGRRARRTACRPTSAASCDSREIVAREMRVTRKLIEKAIEVDKSAPDLADRILSGRVSLRVACREMRGRNLRNALIESGAPLCSERYRLIQGDCFKVEIAPESVDSIITDPVYGEGIIEDCEKLSELAAKALQPGGSLLVMTGQLYLPDILAVMSRHLRYHWMVAYEMPGGSSRPLFPLKVNPHWKAVVWFTKGQQPAINRIVNDVCRSNRHEKTLHNWQQSERGMVGLVEQFSEPGQLVLDPMCGAGTTGAACLRLGRRFIGVDKDEQAIRLSAGRLASVITENN